MTLIIRNREELEHHLVAMHGENWSIRGLARHFSISRNTVRRILRKYADQREYGHDIVRAKQKKTIARASKLDSVSDHPKLSSILPYENAAHINADI
ncbi:MAG: helix-turn-helix domain-containing protein [Desulfobacterales bacterium]|nr:helix-turn-helix domain-containing protein [Desulfobacterales bacterium]